MKGIDDIRRKYFDGMAKVFEERAAYKKMQVERKEKEERDKVAAEEAAQPTTVKK